MAFERRRPDRRVVHHSDRGAVYTSLAFSRRLQDLELAQSFGSTGDCYDNAAVEAFFATLKRELAWIHNTKSWNLAHALRFRAVRLHRRLLQPRTHPATTRPAQPRRLRTDLSGITTFAWDEGEGDRSRSMWLTDHEGFFRRYPPHPRHRVPPGHADGVRALRGRLRGMSPDGRSTGRSP